MNAKEYFEGVRDEVVETARARDMLERMKSREGANAQDFTEARGGGSASDCSLLILQRIDFERRLRQRIASAQAMVGEASELLYGKDGRGGLAKLRGTRYADAICMGYLQAQEWAEVADIMSCSQQWCRELCKAGFAYIDRVGWAKLKSE